LDGKLACVSARRLRENGEFLSLDNKWTGNLADSIGNGRHIPPSSRPRDNPLSSRENESGNFSRESLDNLRDVLMARDEMEP
jgi:hypothetical protein